MATKRIRRAYPADNPGRQVDRLIVQYDAAFARWLEGASARMACAGSPQQQSAGSASLAIGPQGRCDRKASDLRVVSAGQMWSRMPMCGRWPSSPGSQSEPASSTGPRVPATRGVISVPALSHAAASGNRGRLHFFNRDDQLSAH